MSNDYRAILVGGDFHLTSLILQHRVTSVSMYKPHDIRSLYQREEQAPVACSELTYVLVADTPKGVLVYELQN